MKRTTKVSLRYRWLLFVEGHKLAVSERWLQVKLSVHRPNTHPECGLPMFTCVGCKRRWCVEDASGEDDGRCVICAAAM